MTRAVAVALILVAAARLSAAGPPVEFGRDVLPILSDACFHCHGPDEKARKAKLRLDTKDGAFRERNGVPNIVPGKPADSELIRRVASTDADERMPPPSSNRKLTPAQIDTLKRWVQQGARWGRHWAFDPITRPAVPANPERERGGESPNPIDAFIHARLGKEGLKPSPEADRERLIRRVTLDLTGLPPTVAEIDAFLKDTSPTAYEKVVDRLLASPRYGERMAAEWLDVARFADTHGYQKDRHRPVWPYRDWVISAFNRNLRYDDFITWQVAGDLLPNATKEQRLATAFNRLHMQNEEGGIVEEEFRVAYVVDRVNTVGTAFLGLTFECCRCHDHKYDPVSMRDFYSLFAFFQNIDESGQTPFFVDVMPTPSLLLSTDAQDAKIAELRKKVAAVEADGPKVLADARGPFAEWRKTNRKTPEPVGLVARYTFDAVEKGQVANAVDPKKPGKVREDVKLTAGVDGKAAELDGENGFTFPGVGHFHRAAPFSVGIWVKPTALAPRAVVVHHTKAPIDAGSRGYELLLEDGRVAVGLHHMWPGNSLKVRTKAAVKAGEWSHVTFSHDGSGTAAGVRVFINGEACDTEAIRDGLTKDITYPDREPDLTVGHRFRDAGFKGGAVDDFTVWDRAITPLEAQRLAGRKEFAAAWSAKEPNEALFEYFASVVHPPALEWRKRLAAARDELRRYVEPIPEMMVMQELAKPKPAFVLKRGNYDAPGDPVSADVPKVLPPLPPGAPRNRLGLAKWLTSPENPLTARVTVNRAWQQMFGRGLVETADNFGTQGARPSHPELLDWLASEFVNPQNLSPNPSPKRGGEQEGGTRPPAGADSIPLAPPSFLGKGAGGLGSSHPWDYKRLIKLIALSATYRQSSKAPPEALTRDPQNLLLARGPAKRLSAEMLRDHALAASGLLVEKRGGPSVKPYQPAGVWAEAMGSPKYDQGAGDDLYRRSLYTYWKRTAPPPDMLTLDATDRSACTVRRQSTSTPLQALVLLNDVQFVEAARFVGERTLKEGGTTPEDRAAWAFRLLTGRTATDRERTVLGKLYAEQKAEFGRDPSAAKKLLAVGERRADPKLPAADLAAAAAVANALLSHDEAVTSR